MITIVGSYYGATTEAVESLIAHLHSQGKLTMPRREDQIIRNEIKMLKPNKWLSKV
jgi:hypothetical protein